MKRSWFGLGLLLVLLTAGLLVTFAMDRIHDPISQDLDQAAECALLGDWVNAEGFFTRARNRWETWDHFRTCFADHSPVEEIDAGFALLEVYCLNQEETAFAASCQELARKAAAVGEAHGLLWWNLF